MSIGMSLTFVSITINLYSKDRTFLGNGKTVQFKVGGISNCRSTVTDPVIPAQAGIPCCDKVLPNVVNLRKKQKKPLEIHKKYYFYTYNKKMILSEKSNGSCKCSNNIEGIKKFMAEAVLDFSEKSKYIKKKIKDFTRTRILIFHVLAVKYPGKKRRLPNGKFYTLTNYKRAL